MTYIVRYYPKAEAEYTQAYDWYEKQLPGLGDQFESCIANKISSIVENPLIYPKKKSDFRECVVLEFPYIIVYRLYTERNLILILSVFHTSRKPNKKHR